MFGSQDQTSNDSAAALFGQTPPSSSLPPASTGGAINPAPASGAPDVADDTAKMTETAASFTANPIGGTHLPADSAATVFGASPSNTSDLSGLKQQALQKLSPLLSHLDQTPEEKFKTTMMMMQATDNQDLVQQAYDAANAITDEKARAQALLDVVNEINYFTHKDQDKSA